MNLSNNHMLRWMIAAGACLLFATTNAQLMNIENSRLHSDTAGWQGGAGAAFSFIKNKNEVLSIQTNAHIQYKSDKDLYLFIAEYNLLKSGSQQLSDNMYYHFRYNRKLGAMLRWEVFTQMQRNSITNINVRMLAGTGPRLKLQEGNKFKLYLATAAMYEYEEELTSARLLHRDLRNSSYFSFTWLPNEIVSMVVTTYYQPLFSKFTDFRIFNQLSLDMKLTKHFSFSTDWNYLFDNFPAVGAPRYNYSISNGVRYKF